MSEPSFKSHFSHFLATGDGRLHFAAHSHHLWPDVTRDAHARSWELAAQRIDDKWDVIFGELLPQVRDRIAGILNLPDPGTLAFAPNTHELVVRLGSCLPAGARVLTTDGEFHSFNRQSQRWAEDGTIAMTRVPVEPFEDFPERFARAARSVEPDLIYVSQVFFNSGYVYEGFAELAEAAPPTCLIAIDGYHGFMALPTDLAEVAPRMFYLAGGYKYAMSGEGACFMHCPPGFAPRPANTGWFAGFGQLAAGVDSVPYSEDGMRFFGATFDPSGLCRMNAVLGWLGDLGVSVADIHRRVVRLQDRLLTGLSDAGVSALRADWLIPGRGARDRGHFLTFRTASAGDLYDALRRANVVVDRRADRLRIGMGIYHDADDVDELVTRLGALTSS